MAQCPSISELIQRYFRQIECMKKILFSLLILALSIFACIGYNSYIMSKNSNTTNSANSQQNLVANQSLTTTDMTMFHHDLARTGYDPNEPDPQQLTSAWKKSLDGAVYAEPLVIGGHVIAATENDTIYSLDATTG